MSTNTTLEKLINQVSSSIFELDGLHSISLQPVLNNIEALGIAAGKNNRLGFQDICVLAQEIFSDIIQSEGRLNEKQFELLKQWHILVSNYVKDSKGSTINALICFFKNAELSSTITEGDLLILEDMLKTESLSFQVLFAEIIRAIKKNKPFALSLLNEKLTRLLYPIKEKDLNNFFEVGLLFQETIIKIAQTNQYLTHKQRDLILNWLEQAEIFLADPTNSKIIPLLIGIIQDDAWSLPLTESNESGIHSFDDSKPPIPAELTQLLATLENAVSQISSENLDSITAITNDTEKLGLAAGELDLFGFQDICFIIKENLSDMISDKSLSFHNHIARIREWPVLVRNYLSNREAPDCIQKLLNYLTDNQWPNPLADDDLEVLKDIMGIKQLNAEGAQEIVTTIDELESTIVAMPEQIQEVLNETSDDVIDTDDILAAPHTISKDVATMLHEEVLMIQEEVENYKALIKNENTKPSIIVDALSQYALRLERLGSACQAAEMDGLYQTLVAFANNLDYFAKKQNQLTEQQLSLISSIPEKLLGYLEKLGDDISSKALVECLQDDALPNNLMKEVAPALINLLKAVYVSDKYPSEEARKTNATAEDISIKIPADINQELLDGLLQELPGQTATFSAAIQALIDGSGDLDKVQKAQRIAHTVKGAANTVGIKGIAILTHQLEDIMSMLNDLNHLPSPALATAFMDAADCLEEMSEALLNRDAAPAQSQEVLQNILDWANQIESEGVDCLTSDVEEIVAATATKAKDVPADKEHVDEEDSAETILRVPARLIDEVLRLLGETMIITSQLQERVRLSTLQSKRLLEHQNMVQSLASDLEIDVDLNSTVYDHKRAVNQSDVFDSLELEEYNELHTVTHQIVEAAVDSYEFSHGIANDLRDFDELLIDKLRLHHEIQEIIMRTRMLPVKTIVPRLQRIVRQTCRITKKQVTLDIIGSDTLIDSDILNKLIDPLMHILRNSVDHGIEEREQRIQLQKEPEGKIELRFMREGTQIFVTCKDDGAGLDHDIILETAVKRSLVKTGEPLSKKEIYRLILNPGFSTRDKATQTSGRGVGMDVVNTELLAMKGSIYIESEKNKGCLIKLGVPLTLISSHALLLRHLNQTIAVSNNGIEKILHPGDSKTIETDDGLLCEIDGEKFKTKTLASLLNMPEDRRSNVRSINPALLIRNEELNYVVYIQEIIGTRELFIKSMGQYLNNVKGLLGATILGNGNVVPVIDLPELIRTPVSGLHHQDKLMQTNIHKKLPVALVVDDSLSARRALAQVIQDAGFSVRTAKDGLEAIGIIEKSKPDIMLVDMEMPRMNGMELTSHVRGFENTKDIPIIMVTSRSTDKHRKQAEVAGVDSYLTKPFSEDNLLDNVHTLLN